MFNLARFSKVDNRLTLLRLVFAPKLVKTCTSLSMFVNLAIFFKT